MQGTFYSSVRVICLSTEKSREGGVEILTQKSMDMELDEEVEEEKVDK